MTNYIKQIVLYATITLIVLHSTVSHSTGCDDDCSMTLDIGSAPCDSSVIPLSESTSTELFSTTLTTAEISSTLTMTVISSTSFMLEEPTSTPMGAESTSLTQLEESTSLLEPYTSSEISSTLTTAEISSTYSMLEEPTSTPVGAESTSLTQLEESTSLLEPYTSSTVILLSSSLTSSLGELTSMMTSSVVDSASLSLGVSTSSSQFSPSPSPTSKASSTIILSSLTETTSLFLSTTLIPSNTPSPAETTSLFLSTTLIPSNTPSPSPTGTVGSSIWDKFTAFFDNTNVIFAFVGGGVIILLLLTIITLLCCYCCCCCCKRNRDNYSLEEEEQPRRKRGLSNGDVKGTRYRPSISAPQDSYHYKLQQVKKERERIDVFAETEFGEPNVDDSRYYQGHSQVQHSQLYNENDIGPTQSLSKLSSLNPSQIMSQARGGISVDDDIEEEEVTEKCTSGRNTRQSGGGDSPFMHFSDNLPGSRGRKVPENYPLDTEARAEAGTSQTSQYSYLGLGVMHGSDVVFTNTNSMMDDPEQSSDLGMVGIDKALMRSRDSDVYSNRTTSPLIAPRQDEDLLDETPTKEPSGATAKKKISSQSTSRDIALLTSLESETPVKEKPQRATLTQSDNVTERTRKKSTLSSMTSLPREGPEASALTKSNESQNSDLQETPEKHRSHTVSASEGSFMRATGKTRLGKLTSLEYIRASLRMRLKKMTATKESPESERRDRNRKPLKSALRKNNSITSYDSNTSTGSHFTNKYAQDYDDHSPQHFITTPTHHYNGPHPAEYMGYPPPHGHIPHDAEYMGQPLDMMYEGGPMGGAYVPAGLPGPGYMLPSPHDHYLSISPQHMAAGPALYAEQLSPILSVSQFDHYMPHHEIGLLPQYSGHPMAPHGMGYPVGPGEQYFSSQPPNFDDDDEDDLPILEYRHVDPDNGGTASQRNVTWNLKPEEIPRSPVDPEHLTPSSDEEDR